MPTFLHGKGTGVYLNEYDVTSYFRNASRSSSVETAETTTYGKTFKTYIPSLMDGTISMEGLYSGETDEIDDIMSGIVGSATDGITTVLLTSAAVGTRCYFASHITTSYNITSPVADVVTVNMEMQSDNGLFSGVCLHNGSAVSASQNGTGHDGGASTSTGWAAALHVVTNTRNNTFDIKLQDSADNVTYADLSGGAFTQLAAGIKGAEVIRASSKTATVRRYTRAVVTLGAGTGSVTFMVSLSRMFG